MDNFQSILKSNIRTTVVNNMDTDPEDIKHTRRNFNLLGIESGDPTRGYIDHDLDTAIRDFQRDTNLKEDGIMKPKGETENTLNAVLHLVGQNATPPLPPHKPSPKTPPFPERKPETPIEKQKRQEKEKKLKELEEKMKRQKEALEAIKKIGKSASKRARFFKDLSERTWELYQNENTGVH